MLAHTNLAPGFSLTTLARRTDGLSGSDLRETCRNAAMAPVRELMREKGRSGKEGLEAARKEVSVPCHHFPMLEPGKLSEVASLLL